MVEELSVLFLHCRAGVSLHIKNRYQVETMFLFVDKERKK